MSARHEGLTPPGRIASISTSHKGTVPIINAATPDAIRCSAKETKPFPPSKSKVPTIASGFHCFNVGISSPAARRQMTRIRPEIRNRNPACRKGGTVSTANRIARYVEPQTMYKANSAIQIFVFIPFLLLIRCRAALRAYRRATWPKMYKQTLLPARPSCATRHSDSSQTHQPCVSPDDRGSIPRSGCAQLRCQRLALQRVAQHGWQVLHKWSLHQLALAVTPPKPSAGSSYRAGVSLAVCRGRRNGDQRSARSATLWHDSLRSLLRVSSLP